MSRCEDFPCCGHEAGCCPDYDETGKQLNMKCVCGAAVSISSRSSLCPTCLMAPEPGDDSEDFRDFDNREYVKEEAGYDED
jgi:hypothetical protein